MEWISIAISVAARGLSGYAVHRVIEIDTRRSEGRKAVGKAIGKGNALLAWIDSDNQSEHPSEPEQRRRYDAWMQVADAALQKADDGVHLGSFYAQVIGLSKHRSILTERLRRLQEILDKLPR